MPENNRTVITFENGLQEFIESSRLGIGFATTLRNWVPEQDGSLRVRIGWRNYAGTYRNAGDTADDIPVDRRVRGIGYNPKHVLGGVTRGAYLIANAEGAGYKFRRVVADALDNGATEMYTLETVAVADNTKHVPMVMAGGKLLYCTDDFGAGAIGSLRAWDGTTNTVSAIANSRVGRTLTYFRNRVFVAGGKETADPGASYLTVNTYNTQPWRLWWSGLGDITAWDTTSLTNPAGFVDVGKDDGQAIEAVLPFDQGLLVAKSESLYYLAGTGPSSFQLIQLDAGEGAPGAPICITPFGAFIAGDTEAYMYDGNYPVPIDQSVSSSYGRSGAFLTTAYIDGKVYVADEGDQVVCVYDLTTKGWHTETFKDDVNTGHFPGAIHARTNYLLGGPADSTTVPLIVFRRIPEDPRTIDAGRGMKLEASTPELWLAETTSPATLRHVYMRVRQRGGAAGQTGLTVKCYRNGTLNSTKVVAPSNTLGTQRVRLDFGPTAYSLQLTFEQDVPSNEASVFDIEEVVIDWAREGDR